MSSEEEERRLGNNRLSQASIMKEESVNMFSKKEKNWGGILSYGILRTFFHVHRKTSLKGGGGRSSNVIYRIIIYFFIGIWFYYTTVV